MAANQRQQELEKYFLTKSQRSITLVGKTRDDYLKPRQYKPTITSRVHWSPTRRHRLEELPSRGQTDYPLHTTVLDEEETEDSAEDNIRDSLVTKGRTEYKLDENARRASLTKLPQLLPSFVAYKYVDGKAIRFDKNPEDEYDEQIRLALNPTGLQPTMEIREEDVDGVIRMPDIPIKYQNYRTRRESIEKTAKENWILMQDNKEMKKRHAKQWKSLNILFDKQISQTHELLTRRVKEVRGMCKPRCEAISILPSLTQSQRELVEALTVKDSVEFLKERRAHRKPFERFQHAGRLVLIMVHGFNDARRRYHHVDAMSKQPIKGTSSDIFVEVEFEKKAAITPGIAPELHMAFISQPEYRTHDEITQILWVVRGSKAFMDLFPDDMEYEIARRVSYERYDEGRVLAYQTRRPDKFYFVISGKLSLLMEYQLHTGTVTRSVGEMLKGTHSDVEELEKQWHREHHLVAKGGVELLSLEREDFFYLTKFDEGLPLDFLKTVDIFSEFPVEKFEVEPDAICCKYYGRGQVLVEDSNRTPFVYVVKSGRVKVVRYQNILDIDACGKYTTDAKKKPDDPLHTRTTLTTHADAMLGILSYQRRCKTMIQDPDVSRHSPRRSSYPSVTPREKRRPSLSSSYIITPGQGYKGSARRNKTLKKRQSIFSPFSLPSIMNLTDIQNPEYPTEEEDENTGAAKPKLMLPVILNVPLKRTSEALKPIERTWVEEQPKLPEIPTLVTTRVDSNKPLPERQTYLQLDVLQPKEVFGLDHLHEAKFSEGKGVMLISDGAEVITITKRFFLQNANNNTMLKVETRFKDYMDKKKAKEVLYTNSNWDQFKSNTLKETLTTLRRRTKI